MQTCPNLILKIAMRSPEKREDQKERKMTLIMFTRLLLQPLEPSGQLNKVGIFY